jgi:hypothetical protein
VKKSLSGKNVRKAALRSFVKGLDLPEGLAIGGSSIEIKGTSSVSIEGAKGILEYDENLIKINLGEYAVKVMGAQLQMNNYLESTVVISGKIFSVEFAY